MWFNIFFLSVFLVFFKRVFLGVLLFCSVMRLRFVCG